MDSWQFAIEFKTRKKSGRSSHPYHEESAKEQLQHVIAQKARDQEAEKELCEEQAHPEGKHHCGPAPINRVSESEASQDKEHEHSKGTEETGHNDNDFA